MKEFCGKVAVITGGASGIGRAIAERAAREQMKIVLADIEQPALDHTTAMLSEKGASVVGVRTDVSNSEEVEAVAETSGNPHLTSGNGCLESTYGVSYMA